MAETMQTEETSSNFSDLVSWISFSVGPNNGHTEQDHIFQASLFSDSTVSQLDKPGGQDSSTGTGLNGNGKDFHSKPAIDIEFSNSSVGTAAQEVFMPAAGGRQHSQSSMAQTPLEP